MARAYDTLHNLAAHYLKSERANHTLQPTALVHEAFVKLAGSAGNSDWQNKTHFQAVASSAMRQILVDYARQRRAQKRGGGWLRVTLSSAVALDQGLDIDLLALDDALRELAALDERKSRVVELRFFGGLSCREVAETLNVATRTVEADWYMARAWLQKTMGVSG
jgi:RNA polymerase sigma factor (TIGR02999 family)